MIILTILITAPENKRIIQEKKTSINALNKTNPLIMPSHPAHITIKKFYLNQRYRDNIDEFHFSKFIENDKIIETKESLKNNVILKRTTDISLIIIALICGLLIFSNKKLEPQSI